MYPFQWDIYDVLNDVFHIFEYNDNGYLTIDYNLI